MDEQSIMVTKNVCNVAGAPDLVVSLEAQLSHIKWAVNSHSSDPLIDWLLRATSFQGISDVVARKYLDTHGAADSDLIRSQLVRAHCPQLRSYWHFSTCGYQKATRTCAEPEHFDTCPLPRLDLRNGQLSQSAYSLVLFVRDIADGDLVGWIDRRLEHAVEQVKKLSGTERWAALRQAVVDPLTHVHGFGPKVVNMVLSDLLIGVGSDRLLWRETGASMIAVDTLVHNWLHRTGVMRRLGAEHHYGPQCYAEDGCAAVIERLAVAIDTREFNASFPAYFPRFIQRSIWQFCAADELGRCNGNQIDDRVGCDGIDAT